MIEAGIERGVRAAWLPHTFRALDKHRARLQSAGSFRRSCNAQRARPTEFDARARIDSLFSALVERLIRLRFLCQVAAV